ncbi:MAG: alanine--tRNA ligase-related protein, partial [bacterium]|nr:alanine--tRNA ligase-related protein [bacterium]
MIKAGEVRQKYLDFFKARGHAVVPSSPLVPENDPTTLFTGSGMQPMLPYLLGQPYPQGLTRIVDSQKCFRTQDIEEVGDNRHTTMFEMLGNWSLGDYFKKEQLTWFWEFLTGELQLPPQNLYVSLFKGNKEIPKDEEAAQIWQGLGVAKERIFYYDEKKNWWARSTYADMPIGEPG